MSINPEAPQRIPIPLNQEGQELGRPLGLPRPIPPRLPTLPTVPAPTANPFNELPYPAPGDRIKAADFTKLSQSLTMIADFARLSALLFGRSLGEARTVLTAQGYGLTRVISVFGNEPAGPSDPSFDGRRVVSVLPVAFGEPAVIAVVSEAVETRRFAPDLTSAQVSYTYRQALEVMRNVLGDAGMSGLPMESPDLISKTLADAARQIR